MKMKCILGCSLIALIGSLAQASEKMPRCGAAGKNAKLGTQCVAVSLGEELVFERYLDVSDAPLVEPSPSHGWKDQQGKLIWLDSDAKEYSYGQATGLCQLEGRRLPKYDELISLWRSGLLNDLFGEVSGVFWTEEGFLDTRTRTFQFLTVQSLEQPAKVHCVLQHRR